MLYCAGRRSANSSDFLRSGWVAERLKAPVLKTAATPSPLISSCGLAAGFPCGFPRSPLSACIPRPYRLVPLGWVAKSGGNAASESIRHLAISRRSKHPRRRPGQPRTQRALADSRPPEEGASPGIESVRCRVLGPCSVAEGPGRGVRGRARAAVEHDPWRTTVPAVLSFDRVPGASALPRAAQYPRQRVSSRRSSHREAAAFASHTDTACPLKPRAGFMFDCNA